MIRGQSYCFLGIVTTYFFFCLCPFPNIFASSPTRPLCRRDQRDALLVLQKEFPIHNVTVSSWNNSVDCCSLHGVTCDTVLGVVISLRIRSSTIVNTNFTSSSALFKLQHLTHLDLSFCSFQGVIPSSIGNLYHLTFLDFSNNHLVGEIPASLGNLSQLSLIYLFGNHLVGEIPASLGNLNQLRFMALYDNDLKGNIPTSFVNLTELSILSLNGNQFTGGLDSVLPNLTSLSVLDLSSNHFQSSIFPYLSRLHNLEDFDGSDNSFVGFFPTSLLKISSLVNLDLSHNNFGGQIPRSILVLHNLGYLDLSYNNFGGQIPKSISKLENVYMLDLSYNKLEGQVPHCLWRSSKLYSVHLSHNSLSSFGGSVEVIDGAILSELDLASNSFQGPFLQWICKLRLLLSLDLSNNRFTGSIHRCLTHLRSINLRNNSLSGFMPDLWIDNSLESLDVSRNNLVGTLPKSLINCTRMEFLNVKENKIRDTFPFWLGSLQDLKVLVLGANAFYGPVYNPSAYLGFPKLRIIDISNNNFGGSLPHDYFDNWPEISYVWSSNEDFWGDYMKFDYRGYASIDLVYKGVDTDFARIFLGFKAIDFSENQFCGEIPKSVGLLKDLRLLNLSGNTFTGSIPPSLANITKLEILDLSQNNLSGEIPQDLGKLTFLSNINFSYNHLEGLVPQSTQFGSQNCSSFIGNLELHGLEKICGEIHHVPIPTSQQSEESFSEPEEKEVNWIAAAIAFGPGVFCGLVIGHIFTSYKHEWLRTKLF